MEITRMRELAITGIAFQRERLDAELRELVAEQQTELRQVKLLQASVIEEPRARIRRRKNGRRKWGAPRTAAVAVNGKKPCKDCGKTKPLSEFHRSPAFTDGHNSRCKDCQNELGRQKRAAKRAGKSQASPPPRRRTARQEINPHTLKVEPLPAPQDPAVTGEPLICGLCNSPCSTPGRYRNHMKLVHKKEVAA